MPPFMMLKLHEGRVWSRLYCLAGNPGRQESSLSTPLSPPTLSHTPALCTGGAFGAEGLVGQKQSFLTGVDVLLLRLPILVNLARHRGPSRCTAI